MYQYTSCNPSSGCRCPSIEVKDNGTIVIKDDYNGTVTMTIEEFKDIAIKVLKNQGVL